MATVELRDICLHRGARVGGFAIENLNLTVPDGKTVVVLGPTGCGKTTLLRIAAGLQDAESGQVLFDGVDIQNSKPGERGIGMVFQNYALYPWTSRRNILSYFQFRKHTPELDAEAEAKYRRTADLLGVDIQYLADRDARHLSGGEKQRVALGRCITREPRLFLLDEPFSNLDAKLRQRYRFGLRRLLSELAITTIYVTHDQQEALMLADLLAVMTSGRIEQVGVPDQVYRLPKSMFVADFLNLSVDAPAINFLDGETVSSEWAGRTLGIRPEDFEIDDGGRAAAPTAWTAIVTSRRETTMARSLVLTVRFRDQELYLSLPAGTPVELGQELRLKVERMHVFDPASGRRLDTVKPS
jgi:ABC-type sugar transport system ATPase subunit